MRSTTKTRLAELGLIYCAVIWGSTFFLVKAAVTQIDPVALVAYRFLFSALLMGGLLAYLRKPLWRDFSQGLWLGLMLVVLYVAQTVGLVYTAASNSGFITGLFIVFVPPLGWLLYRKRPHALQLGAIALAVAGLWLLTGGAHGANRGDWLTLLCAITYAGHVLYAGRCMERGADPYVLNFQQILVTGVGALLATFAMHLPLLPAHSGILWVVLFLALFPTLSAFLIQLIGQRHVDATRTALIFTLEPVFAAIFAWTIGGEQMLMARAIGGWLMVAAMVVSELAPRKR